MADVVVTARQRPELAHTTPLALSAITGERIERLRPIQLSDLTGAAPNFAIEPAGGLDTVLIRGVGSGGRTIGFGQGTAVYTDGVYGALPPALNPSVADADRVEVLRGPQGALFGRNTVSGAVDVVHRAPGAKFGGEARLWGGDHGDAGVFAAADLPAGDGLLTRVSLHRERRDGFTTNLYDGSHRVGEVDLQAYRASARLQATPRLRFDLSGDWSLDRSQRNGFEAVSNPVGAGTSDPFAPAPFQIDENVARVRRNQSSGATLRTTYGLSGGGAWTAISAIRTAEADRRSDNDYSPLDLLSTNYRDHYRQISQEVRLASGEAGPLRYVAGVFFLHLTAVSARSALFGKATTMAGLGVAPGAVVPNWSRIETTSTAAFANLDYTLAPHWTVGAGLRLNRERRDLVFDLDGRQSGPLRIATLTDFRDRDREHRATPALSLTYAPHPGLTVYGRYAEGFKSGGWNVDFLNTAQVAPAPGSTATPFAFGPETVRAYEAGVKGRFWGGRAHLDLTVFTMRFRGYQSNKLIAYPGGASVFQLTNAASARSSGVEFSADVQPTPLVRLTLDAASLDARFGSFPGGGAAGADASGNRLPFSPRFTLSAGIDLTAPLPPAYGRLSLFLRDRLRSSLYTGQENDPYEPLRPSQVLDGRLDWRAPGAPITVSLWARNLANARYLTNRVRDFLGAQTVSQGDPRTVGVELSGRF